MPKCLFNTLVFVSLFIPGLKGQPVTYLKVFDPNLQYIYEADKGENIWSIDGYIFLENGYVDINNNRVNQLFKIDGYSGEIVSQTSIGGPQGDLALSSAGGYCVTSDKYVLITGEWRDYTNAGMGTFLTKLDTNLNQVWINFFPELPPGKYYGDGVAQSNDQSYLLYFTQNTGSIPIETLVRVIKTDTSGNLLYNKIIPDTFRVSAGYGSITPTDDGHFFLSSLVTDVYFHPSTRYNTLLHKINTEAEPVWSRVMEFAKFDFQSGVSTTLPGGGGAIMWMKDTISPDPALAFNFNVLYGIDSEGKEVWHYEWPLLATRTVYRIITARNSDIIGCGYYSKGSSKGKSWLFRMTKDGEMLWERHYSDSIQRPWSPLLEMLDVCELEDGRIAATGIAFDQNSAGSLNPNVALLVVDADGCIDPGCTGLTHYITGVNEPFSQPPILPALVCSPNPASAMATINLPDGFAAKGQRYEWRVFDNLGQLVYQQRTDNLNSRLNISTTTWKSGTYQALLFVDGRPAAGNKMIIQH